MIFIEYVDSNKSENKLHKAQNVFKHFHQRQIFRVEVSFSNCSPKKLHFVELELNLNPITN
jgi:hypothetical protein